MKWKLFLSHLKEVNKAKEMSRIKSKKKRLNFSEQPLFLELYKITSQKGFYFCL